MGRRGREPGRGTQMDESVGGGAGTETWGHGTGLRDIQISAPSWFCGVRSKRFLTRLHWPGGAEGERRGGAHV